MGGAEVYLLRLMTALAAAGRACTALAPRDTALWLRLEAAGLDRRAWPPALDGLVVRRGGGGAGWRRAAALAASLGSRRWVARLQAEGGSILHLNTTRAAFAAGRRSGAVAEVKDALTPPFFSARMAAVTARRLARAAEVAVANSGFIARHLVAAGFPAGRVVTIPNGLDLDSVRPLDAGERARVRALEGWGPTELVLCCTGRLAAWKGQHLAVEALVRFPAARLVLVGDGGFDGPAYAQRLQRLASDLGVAGRVSMTGYRDDALRLMGAADIVLHTSVRPEPLGLTPIEAQALGVPVVAAAAGGPLETVADRETGYLFEPGSVDDLCRGIEWAAAADRAQVAKDGRARACALFDMATVVSRYQQVYAQL